MKAATSLFHYSGNQSANLVSLKRARFSSSRVIKARAGFASKNPLAEGTKWNQA
jgi:hypothetical protein